VSTHDEAAFEAAFPVSDDPQVRDEIDALAALFGCAMPAEIARVLELERHPVLAPTPRELVALDKPFEALILRAQELDDCVPLLFPLTGSVYLRRFRRMDLLGHVTGVPGQPVMPFVGWRREKWAYDLPSLLQLVAAMDAFDTRADEQLESLLQPIWRRVGPTEWTEDLFYELGRSGAAQRLEDATTDQQDLRPSLKQWWRHERALFYGFAMMGKFRAPERAAFDIDPFAAFDREHLTRDLGLQMALLWFGWFVPRGDLLGRAMAATEGSTSLLVRDARRLIGELQDGRTMVGRVDFAEARRTYKTWIEDPAAYEVEQRRRRREALEKRVEPSEHGIALGRAQWPLHAEPTTSPELPSTSIQWDAETRVLQVADAELRTLPPPEPDTKIYLARNGPSTALSPDGRRFYCNCTVHRPKADRSGWENAPMIVEHDLDRGTWRELFEAAKLAWFACTDDGRWLRCDADGITLLRDLGAELEGKYSAFLGQPRTLHLPELGVVIAYGSADLVNGRDPDDPRAPWVRVIAYWRERLECIAAFPIDGVEIVVDRTGDTPSVGLVAADREVAWELRGLQAGVAAWREDSQRTAAQERAKREAFGEITIDRAIEALNAFAGTGYGPEYQEWVNEAFADALAALRTDPEAVALARAASHPLEIATPVRNAFGKEMNNGKRGPLFMDFALKCTILVPAYADIVVRAAATSAFAALRDGG
jgi:hypothetical protein